VPPYHLSEPTEVFHNDIRSRYKRWRKDGHDACSILPNWQKRRTALMLTMWTG
jgi:hypothetical protein